MKLSISLVVAFVCVIVVEARLQRFESGIIDPTQDRESSLWSDWEYVPLRTSKRNRMCLINAGLSQGCDLSDILLAKQQASKFMSFAGPGR
ncbi:hypothetical protein KIN20_014958 [Parelaphostrongylus tenuis]|uniref:Uncharacterized protein n=1 Tax=Parelaphostrongylus tenuis TaxID=148309 RepID=A0AAD5MHP6_PARTN|nr:hypothetical protein KIN20_014958 [Parelaphostrongylus tenuis]